MMPKDRGPVKKARKSAAILVAERDIAELKADVAGIKKIVLHGALYIISGLLTIIGFLVYPHIFGVALR